LGEAVELSRNGIGLGDGGIFGGQSGFGRGAGDFVEADGDGLAEVHGGLGVVGFDDDEGVAPGEIVGGEAVLFAAEDEGGPGLVDGPGRMGSVFAECVEVVADLSGGFGKAEGFLDGAAAIEGAGAEDEGAVGDGFGEGFVDAGVAEQIGCADGGFGFHPVLGEGGDDGEVMEAEVGHGSGGGADVEGVARGDEDDVEAVGLGLGEQTTILVPEGEGGSALPP